MKHIFYIFTLLIFTNCRQSKSQHNTAPSSETSITNINSKEHQNLKAEQKPNPTDFLPNDFVVFEKIIGDLNKDDIDDCVLFIKGTDKDEIIKDEYRGQLDRNRRGIIVLFNKNGKYELALKNFDCFSSENEDGGVYFAPVISIEIKNGNLYTYFGHGRYGYWKYTFRFQNSDFELIGYDQSDNQGPIIIREMSIDFLRKKKQEKLNTNVNGESGQEIFEETWKNIEINTLLKLSEIKDFDELDMTKY